MNINNLSISGFYSRDGKREKKIERENQKSFVVGRVVESTILFQERI